jgi:hypothetical protein
MGWDSNPRYPYGHAGFQDRCLKPLGHPSKPLIILCFCLPRPPARNPLLPNGLQRPVRAHFSDPERSVYLGLPGLWTTQSISPLDVIVFGEAFAPVLRRIYRAAISVGSGSTCCRQSLHEMINRTRAETASPSGIGGPGSYFHCGFWVAGTTLMLRGC